MKKFLIISIFTYLIFFWKFLLPTHYFWKSDAQYTYVPARFYLYEKILNENSFPFWTERIFNGFPIYADFENGYLNPINVLSILIFGPLLSYKILHIATYLIGSLCLYLWMRNKGLGILSFTLANLIFFFNTLMLNHQIHFNVIAAFYLLPTVIYLIDEVIKKLDLKKIFLLSVTISYIALWGHAQSTFLVILAGIIYFSFHCYQKISLRKNIFIISVLSLLTLIQILPQYIPSIELYQQSLRENEIDYKQGSMIPRMAPIIIIPYLFGESESFQGSSFIHKHFTYSETYIYIGIAAFVIGIIGIYLSQKDRLFFCLYTYIIIFFVLSFNANNPLFNENTPILNLFRYWQRSSLLLIFAISVFAGIALENIKTYVFSKKDFLISTIYILIPILYLYLISFYEPVYYQTFIRDGINRIYNLTSPKYLLEFLNFQIVTLIFFISVTLMVGFYFFKDKIRFKHKEFILGLILISTTLFDNLYFNLDVLDYRIDYIKDHVFPSISKEYENIRVVPKKLELNGLEHLYIKSWSPFGYSQFREEEYVKFFPNSGLGNLRKSRTQIPVDGLDSLANFGIIYILDYDKEIKTNDRKIDLIKENIDGTYKLKKEGEINLEINSDTKREVTLLLKHNKNWEIKNNNQVVNYEKKDLFIKLNLQNGINNIYIKYIPYGFYKGIFFSIFLTIILLIILKFKKEIINDKV